MQFVWSGRHLREYAPVVVALVFLLGLLVAAGLWLSRIINEHAQHEVQELAARKLAAAQRMQGFEL
jgi:CHASE1-domain containing sensor protein